MSVYTIPQQLIGLIVWLVITFIAAVLGAQASINAPEFYQSLQLPSWAPPASVFGPVWTVLYLLMALAAWWVWRAQGFLAAREALSVYLIQLVFNALWSWAFFQWHNGALAFGIIIVLWLLVAATINLFWRIKPLSGALLLPYLAWISFAAVLNWTVWRMNPALLGQ
ncbi:MAG: TspO/MBR family protein [Thiofilum sp.]|uniref:TspO/MBR family protein n=1 Tax=Thiofilum sp. TaxID=2212733 RepID=UPI0025D608E7|nr:TspO/MBR family protein [Thiofilum sp.]MBK8454562.1 tryptophan-rich sensory protein [Thiofilum sp.]